MAGGRRRHGAARPSSGRRGSQLDELQPDAQRWSGDRRRHRRGGGRCGRVCRQRDQLRGADRRSLPLEARAAGKCAAARIHRSRHLGRAALRRHVTEHREGAAARLRLRPERHLDPGTAAAGGARPHPGRAAALRRAARRLWRRRHRRRLAGRPAARHAVQRMDRAPRLRRLCRIRHRLGAEQQCRADLRGTADRRRELGDDAVALQHDGAAVDAALGRRPGPVPLPDGHLRRHGAGQLDLGCHRGGAGP